MAGAAFPGTICPGFLLCWQPFFPRPRLPHSGCPLWALWPAGHLGIRDLGQLQLVLKLWGREEVELGAGTRKEGKAHSPVPFLERSQPTKAPQLRSRPSSLGRAVWHVGSSRKWRWGGLGSSAQQLCPNFMKQLSVPTWPLCPLGQVLSSLVISGPSFFTPLKWV